MVVYIPVLIFKQPFFMKRIFMSAVALMLVTAAVHAQTDSTQGQHHEWRQGQGQQENMYQQLNLTADQQSKLKAMRDDFKKQADAIKAQNLSEDEQRTKMQALHQQQRQQIDAILTTDQKQQLEKLRSERREQMNNQRNSDSTGKGNRQSWNNHKGGQNIQKELNLTSDQQAKVKAIRTDFKSKAEAIRNDQSLTKDQKHAKFQELMQQQRDQMKTVLTKEQQDKWQQLRSERNAHRNATNS
jgi:Spy/CpxP family protein refolding chaperone